MSEATEFQSRVSTWMVACFGRYISANLQERNHRFLEEALELVQAAGCTAREAHAMVEYVYSRPPGDVPQEIGGVMVTLAGFCAARHLGMEALGERELIRCWAKTEEIRSKQTRKPDVMAAPQNKPSGGDRLAEIEERWAIRPEWVRDAREWDSEIEWLIGEVNRLGRVRYLPLACPVCGRVRVEYDPVTFKMRCEKCGTEDFYNGETPEVDDAATEGDKHRRGIMHDADRCGYRHWQHPTSTETRPEYSGPIPWWEQ